ncbi:MAG: hypothetical protein A3A04_00910 [Candidatus Harrisonbacteria bacterium RIFCSPLOWO2_01_FULL_40_28]|uniref:Uncharacterized protein n=1 Tax=Candidatus Harrisonbacteria bacterium RIFCSPLOWO2_01_FULL_40_28 TaxID=1798406 RepID=A0A1G1ZQS0_9BACT|nr:MAG: hypothetical protein A3A04_00910 [Candidatus Harrisonbacteria bacterium RIFCSPLOWO2_01_FULL_40_28]
MYAKKGNAKKEREEEIPVIAKNDQNILKKVKALYVSCDSFIDKETTPIDKSAAATSRDAKGSITGQRRNVRNEWGSKNKGIPIRRSIIP